MLPPRREFRPKREISATRCYKPVMNRIDLDGRVAVVTGGSGGIGFATAHRMIASGASVVLWDRDRAALARAGSELSAAAQREVDVTNETSVANATEEAIGRYG